MQRDLARPELWEESVQRSRERRFQRAQAPTGRPRRARQRPSSPAAGVSRAAPASAVELPDRSDVRELSDFDPWQRSLARSRARRDALASAPTFEIPPGRVSVAAAALLLTGGSVAVASGTIGGDGPDWSATTSGGQGDAIAKAPSTDAHRAAGPAREKSRTPKTPGTPKKAATAKSATAPAPQRPTEPVGTAAVDGTITATPEAQRALRPPPPPPRKTTTVAAKKKTNKHRPFHRGGGVAALQRALDVPVDGSFGPSTQRALKRFQHAHGIASDGVVGSQTRAALHLGKGSILKRKRKAGARHHGKRKIVAAAHKRAPAAHTRHGGGVRDLQRALGLSPDGVLGPSTEKALRRWQRSHGLPGDGVAGPQTRRALHLGSGPVLKRKGRHHGRRHSSTGGGNAGGGSSSVVQRVIAAANQIATKPYVYGGGHGSFNSSGYDCSGSVSYALHGGGLLSSPLDSSALMSYGSPGPGKHITIFANGGHVWMTIDGRRFDTSGRSGSGSRWGGGSRTGGGFAVRHPAGY